ncbi:MAG: IclR family transcriptional regulator C-terminal domain-containing protein [Bradyrhizobium sp.]
MRTISKTLDDKRKHDRDFVGALEKGLAVIEAFDTAVPQLTLTAAARKTGLTRAAARRYLLTLVALGYAETDGKIFRLMPRVLRLGYAYLSTASLPKLAQPILDRIGERVREVVSLATLDGTEVVFLARSASRRVLSATTSVGMRLPAYCTAMGRIMLAGLSDAEAERLLASMPLKRLTPRTRIDMGDLMAEIAAARTNGYAVSDEELEMGLRSIAVPVTNAQGQVMLAMSVSLQAAHMTVEEMEEKILPELNAARPAISSML